MHIKTLKLYILTFYYIIFLYIDVTVRCYNWVKCIYLFRYCFEIKIFKIPSGLFELYSPVLLSILHITTQHTRISYSYLTLLLNPLDPFFPATLWVHVVTSEIRDTAVNFLRCLECSPGAQLTR